MTIMEYKDLKESLYIGHDFEFKYKNNTYFFEKEEDCHKLYLLNEEDSSLVDEVQESEINDRIDLFFDKKIFDGKSFNEIYSDITIIDIE